MKEIIVIRTSDPDGSVFHSILDILQGKDIQILHADSRKDSVVTLGGIQIFPEQRRVLNQGAEVHLNYGEFSILYCMAKSPEQVFSREQLYNAAWEESYEFGTNTVATRFGVYGRSWSLTPNTLSISKLFSEWGIRS